MLKDRTLGAKLVTLILAVLVAVVSAGVISPYVSDAGNRTGEMAVLDEMKLTALGLTATVTGTSFLVSAMPDDTGSPIADELAELSNLLMIIVCVVYLEKFLLTTSGFVSFSILIPAAAVLFGITQFRQNEKMKALCIKLVIFALLLFLLIPVSVGITCKIQETFQESLDYTFAAAERFSDEVQNAQTETSTNVFSQIWEGIGSGISKGIETAKNVLSTLTDAVAVLLITACVIPLLTVLLFLWAVRRLFGLQIKLPDPQMLSSRLPHAKRRRALPDQR